MKILKKTLKNDFSVLVDLTENINNLGVMSSFDGNILSENENTFRYVGYTNNNKLNILLDTDIIDYQTDLIKVTVDWGDDEINEVLSVQDLEHHYVNSGVYNVTCLFEHTNKSTLINKTIHIPSVEPIDQEFTVITFGDYLINENWNKELTYDNIKTNLKFVGIGHSRVEELKNYGSNTYNGVTEGIYEDGVKWKKYVIDNLEYIDTSDGLTTITGFTGDFINENVIDLMLTRNEHFLGFIDEPLIQSDVYIERGKQSVNERNFRICEIDNMGELISYGNGFFKIKKQ